MTSGEPHPFRWCNIQLYMGQLQLDLFEAKASQLRAADWSGMIFTVQKSGVPREIVRHARSGALHAFPVVGLSDIFLLLSKHSSPRDVPLGTYLEIPSGPLCYIKSSNITKALKSAARIHGAEFGIGPDDVSAGCLHSTGAMALFYGVLTAFASASSVGGKVGPCSGTYIFSLERPCAASPLPCSRGAR